MNGQKLLLSQIDWNKFICCNANGSSVWALFLKILWTNVDEFLPYSSRGQHKNVAIKRRRYPTHIRKLVTKRRRLWKAMRTDPNDLNKRHEYRVCTNELRHENHLLVTQEENNIIQTNNVGVFYKYINNRIRYRKAIGSLLDDSGNVVTSDQRKAEMFNNYYSKVGIVDDDNVPVTQHPYNC